jgi:transposase
MIKFSYQINEVEGMGYKAGVDKKQLLLFPACLDDYLPEDHICRVISAFTGQLDMAALGFKYAECKDTGSPPYDPRMMLNLYIYGYLHRVRSSRRLRDEAKRNVEAIWLMDGLRPDDKTICNFRKDNGAALRKTFREFVRMCRALQLYSGELQAQDSTKFRADNSRKNNHNKTTVQRELEKIDKKVNEYLAAIEQGDKEEEGRQEPSGEAIKAALEKLQKRKEKFKRLHTRLEKEGEVSTVDPDARLMHSNGDARKLDVCYNIQTVVDGKHHLIVDFDAAERSDDHGNLEPMMERTKEALGVQTITCLADSGYYDGQDIAACEGQGVTCLVAKGRPGGAKKPKAFSREQFVYDRENDFYSCPVGNRLRYMRDHKHSDGKAYRLYANYGACGRCPVRAECTKRDFRDILRPFYQDTLDVVDERTRKNKALYRKRQEIVEHVFGTIKAVWGYKQFLCRTKSKITGEISLAYLAYNMRRYINIAKEARGGKTG